MLPSELLLLLPHTSHPNIAGNHGKKVAVIENEYGEVGRRADSQGQR